MNGGSVNGAGGDGLLGCGDPFRLDGRVLVVTGSGQGIGRAIGARAAERGATVVGLDRDAGHGQKAADALAATGAEAAFLQCDMADPDQIEAAFERIADRYGQVDILVNNAAAGSHTPPADLTLDEWQHVVDVNVTGYLLAAQAAGALMIAGGRGGSIVNMSSIGGSSALGRGNFAYSITKGAVNQLTRELAVEWAAYGIRVNAIQPCQVRTEGIGSLLADQRFDGGKVENRFVAGIPLGRLAEPSDIAAVAVFLGSDAAGFVTGVILPVDGGNLALNAGGTIGSARTAESATR
ncbi:SDR family NAD(P)-dependent oxidoreductase [Sphaerisporangium rubeum]|uniref:NAD(P)-dependent dehydrogenase (Short-subunit alcohol dehydrogenase family) n=1 Tax=Sphaerisporangium rubeum TaxID=321317 RepID=A0A7X0II75_9ACTN|nr:NAD(P)-dependent dehydrogenase (short-subunit alcohol dehydrogenase family) [Sphaerisporangium rubeum]